MNAHPLENMARTVALLQCAPRTLQSLASNLDVLPRNARRYIRALELEGLVECRRPLVPGKGGRSPMVIEWKGR